MDWLPHALLNPPTDEQMALMPPETLLDVHRLYHEAIRNEKDDPYTYGMELDHWKVADELLENCDFLTTLGGNRSGKSEWAAKRVVQSLVNNPGSIIWCWSQNFETSVQNQQPYIYKYLPKEFKKKIISSTANINYSVKRGFTDSKFILPNGSICIFRQYSQWENDPTIVEGAELGCHPHLCKVANIGNWGDELMPLGLLNTINPYRLMDRNSKMILTFTPILGYNDAVKSILENCKVTQFADAPLLGINEKVPLVQEDDKGSCKVMYFHSINNPYAGYARLAKELQGAKREDILIRAYGVPTKSITTKFPAFNEAINVVKHENLPFAKNPDYEVTRYCIIDPAGSKPWFITWIAVDSDQTYWVYREWPDESYGPWADFGKNGKSKSGEGATPLGYGINDYVELIRSLEDGEVIFERLIDPRMGASEKQGMDGATTIIDELNLADMPVYPAPGLDILNGEQSIQSKLAWDRSNPLSAMNAPHMYVSDRCRNTIQCIQEYTGSEGFKEAWKDPVDNLRYACTANIEKVDASQFESITTWKY